MRSLSHIVFGALVIIIMVLSACSFLFSMTILQILTTGTLIWHWSESVGVLFLLAGYTFAFYLLYKARKKPVNLWRYWIVCFIPSAVSAFFIYFFIWAYPKGLHKITPFSSQGNFSQFVVLWALQLFPLICLAIISSRIVIKALAGKKRTGATGTVL